MSENKYIAQGTLAQRDDLRDLDAGTVVYLAEADGPSHPRWVTGREDAFEFSTIDAARRVAHLCRSPAGGSPARPSIEVVTVEVIDPDGRTVDVHERAQPDDFEEARDASGRFTSPHAAAILTLASADDRLPQGPFTVTITGPNGEKWWEASGMDNDGLLPSPIPTLAQAGRGAPELLVNLLTGALRIFAGRV